uniref:SAFB-like transcription modulator n=1 Tax=Diabrotica virgifera virgifera TaxID=50390 RepID=A0A6P7H4P9_DIAVI
MSSQHKQKITDLLVKELRNELEERVMDTTAKKADLVERLKNTLQEEGQDPETYLFKDKHAAVISSISKLSTDITSLENKVSGENSKVSENKVSGEISHVSLDVLKVSTDITSLENKISKVSGDISSLESKMTNENSASISKVTSDFDDKISSLKSTIKGKIKEMEKKMEETEKVDKGMEPILTDIKYDETKYKLEPRPIVEGSVSLARVKVPNFDGKSSWNSYKKQFETVSRAKGWSEKDKAVNLVIAFLDHSCRGDE